MPLDGEEIVCLSVEGQCFLLIYLSSVAPFFFNEL